MCLGVSIRGIRVRGYRVCVWGIRDLVRGRVYG